MIPQPARLAHLERRLARLSALSNRISWWRVLAFLCAAVFITLGALGTSPAASYALSGVSALVFALLVREHTKIDQMHELFQSRIRLEHRRAAMSRLDWEKVPPAPQQEPELHLPPYMYDLDIVGERSLLRLLNFTVSISGYTSLRELFLSNGISDDEIRRRAALTQELSLLPVLRHTFLARTCAPSGTIETDRILASLNQPLCHAGAQALAVALYLVHAATLLAFVFAYFRGGSPYFLIPLLSLLGMHFLASRKIETKEAYEWSVEVSIPLDRIRKSTEVLEKHALTDKPALRAALAPFARERGATTRLKELERISGALAVRQNFIAHLLVHLLLPWNIYWTLKLEKLRESLLRQLPEWQSALANFEASVSIAMFAHAHPEHAYAEVLASNQEHGAFLECLSARHPLISRERVVANDLRLDPSESCILITGSNMSGKSTFLRTIGINYLLAKAGAPVAARNFRFRNVPIFTSLRGGDSLQEGLSSFYAEVRRLKEVLDQAKEHPPVFFLIDEIFRGTNNRERLIGSRAYIRELSRTGSFGLVTTHDLELATLEETSQGIANYHFKESISEGVMTFSYRKERGPCPTTNALQVMRMSGLPIE